MTYGIKNQSALFRGHNQTQQASVPVGGEFATPVLSECTPHPSGGITTNKAYVYGDLRTSGYVGQQQSADVAFKNTITLPSEGWQIASNRAFATGSDDAQYGIVNGRIVMYSKEAYSNELITSDVEETRVFGLRLIP